MANLAYYLEMAKKLNPAKAGPRAWNYMKYKSLKREAHTRVSRYAPQIAQILVTKRCNLDCGYCAAGKIMKEGIVDWKKSEATLENTKKVFENELFAKAILVDLLGGEPLLVKEFDLIVAHLTEQGYLTNTSTNGTKLLERIRDLKQAGISRINLSYYDVNRDILENDLYKVNQVFPVHMSYVLVRSEVENQPEKILEMARFCKQAGSKSIRFWSYRPMGDDKQVSEIIAEGSRAFLDLKQRVDKELPGFSIWPVEVKRENVEKRCPQLWQRVGADPMGEISICCGIDEPLRGENSNLFDAGSDVVFNHPTLVEMRGQLIDKNSPPPDVCKSCNLLGDPGW
jgi:MoaA/NifB/PqqE/SkfB family radical SAM enzyme